MKAFKIVYRGGEGEIIEKKSRFIATVKPVQSEEEASAFIAEEHDVFDRIVCTSQFVNKDFFQCKRKNVHQHRI